MKRCWWADPRSELYIAYHDNEWGQPEHDDCKLFEMLTLESFQAGLSWLTILKDDPEIRMAFDGFQPDVVAQYGPEKVEELMADAGIVRNRRKIEAAIRNAGVYLSIQKEFGSFDCYLSVPRSFMRSCKLWVWSTTMSCPASVILTTSRGQPWRSPSPLCARVPWTGSFL